MNTIKVKFVDLARQYESFKTEILTKISAVIDSGDYILGQEVREFEKNFAQYCGCKYAVGVANGTDALFLCMKLLGIGQGDEVITATNSFIATAGAIVAVGAKPVLVDVREDYNIDPYLIEKAITKNTKAIIPVHLYGKPADMKHILEISTKHRIFVIEDAAQAVGSRYNGKTVGTFGIAGCYSLHPLKNLNCCGDGGIITTDNNELSEKLIKLRNHGLKNRDECDFFGYNSRLSSVQAAILNVKLKYLPKFKKRIDEIVAMYRNDLQDYVTLPIQNNNEDVFYHRFVVSVNDRDELQSYLLKKGIEAKIHYPIPIHLQKASESFGYTKGDFPIAEKQAKHILSLPLYPELSDEQVKIVIKAIQSF